MQRSYDGTFTTYQIETALKSGNKLFRYAVD